MTRVEPIPNVTRRPPLAELEAIDKDLVFAGKTIDRVAANQSLQADRGPCWFFETLRSARAAAAERVVRAVEAPRYYAAWRRISRCSTASV